MTHRHGSIFNGHYLSAVRHRVVPPPEKVHPCTQLGRGSTSSVTGCLRLTAVSVSCEGPEIYTVRRCAGPAARTSVEPLYFHVPNRNTNCVVSRFVLKAFKKNERLRKRLLGFDQGPRC